MVAAAAVLTKTAALAAQGTVLAKGTVNTNDITPGVLGFLVVAGMAIVLVFLLRSMNRQFRKLPPPEPEPDGQNEAKPGAAGDTPPSSVPDRR
jgi:hypothetical protein